MRWSYKMYFHSFILLIKNIIKNLFNLLKTDFLQDLTFYRL